MTTLTIFANFYIDDKERFLRMQDSFRSFKDIDAVKWVINARGKYKSETLSFLKSNLGDKLIPYMLEGKKGWFYDTQQMLSSINTNYVLFWVEDHVNLADVARYKEILNEMKASGSEYLWYSWWRFGKLREPYLTLKKDGLENISTFILDKSSWHQIKHHRDYLISMCGILSLELFKKIILDNKIYPRQWSKFTPLNFEKRFYETRWLPIKYALPNYELFASIDDDLGCEGYSLQSRGLYPRRVLRGLGRKVRNPVTPYKIFFRSHIRPYIPDTIYNKKVAIGNYINKLKRYIILVLNGE